MNELKIKRNVPRIGLHWMKADPVIPARQLHVGMWFITSQTALWPQVPGHGLTHLLRIQALSRLQSEFNTHSGLHPLYALPWYSGKQEHIPFEQIALEPHGEGIHGSSYCGSFSKNNNTYSEKIGHQTI